jgi:hypothetical protein
MVRRNTLDYSTLVMAAVHPREAGFWLACCLVLYRRRRG